MSKTVTIRLRTADRDILEAEARERGMGISTLMRDLAEAEARRLHRASIRAEGQRIVDYVRRSPGADAELSDLGTPQVEAP